MAGKTEGAGGNCGVAVMKDRWCETCRRNQQQITVQQNVVSMTAAVNGGTQAHRISLWLCLECRTLTPMTDGEKRELSPHEQSP